MRGISSRHSYKMIVVMFVSCGLLGSFGLHAIQIPHDHPGHEVAREAASHHGSSQVESVAEYLHGTEKKFLLALLAATLLIGTFVLRSYPHCVQSVSTARVASVWRRRLYAHAEVPPMYTLLFAKGILNPKTH